MVDWNLKIKQMQSQTNRSGEGILKQNTTIGKYLSALARISVVAILLTLKNQNMQFMEAFIAHKTSF